ncbi:NADPH-dependent FMN reductase [Paramicrobacterium agarici]|uniref:NAD(P)H-dependent FMN reductase n=1 Tax=Paramicrobacterium agarici TaxID=630514 RepID=A0A2A9DSE3_9MICO|nr:NAD(P)H-dependent oxidoreductase [Microbacterium agarici]PFG29707.1 NAD(P)H-dependent FMN reductase [Microbacterium agarici]
MPRLLLVIASTRPGRVGAAVGEWAVERAREHGRFEIEVADLAQLQLPFLDEPEHPRLRAYVNEHTLRWSRQVDGADAFMFVMPEYNHSFSAPLKNALDFLFREWSDKPVGLVSYGGLAGGTRAVVALQPVLANLGMIGVHSNVEIAWVAEHVADGVFAASERHERALAGQLDELADLHARASAVAPGPQS